MKVPELNLYKVCRRWFDGTIHVGFFILYAHPSKKSWARLYPLEEVISSERIGVAVDGRVQ